MKFKAIGLHLPHMKLVEHNWTGSYLIKPYGAHYRRSLRWLSKRVLKRRSDWTGSSVWCSPAVCLAPPA